MPISEGREYRLALPFEVGGDESSMIIEGYATTFHVPYTCEGTDIKEIVRSSALDAADMSDVILQYDHAGYVYARVSNGTLVLERDAHGLHIRADLSKSSRGEDMYNDIKNGLIVKMSWGFIVPEDGWEYDLDTNTRIITKVSKIYDVSAVSIPANQDTNIYARSAFDGEIENIRRESAERERALVAEREERIRLSLLLELQ